ncbi:MAG TPA: 2-isopropylmalate synthase [Gemmatimonadaceae bacterium]|nr:2-isopropylmalate synthase [Gemmatimonadaceae bacterium]
MSSTRDSTDDSTGSDTPVHPGDRVAIFDTTLRDGEQAPGCTMTASEKLRVARQLARLNVDVIEAGFPAASSGEHDAVYAIASELGAADGSMICGLARAIESDIDACASAIRPALRRRIHTFIATSDIHLEHKLRLTHAQVLRAAERAVRYATAHARDVEFSAEDAGRSDPVFLCEVIVAAAEAGAATINVPDTVGYNTPSEYGALVAMVCEAVRPFGHITVSTHCHNDLGMAVANALAGVQAGARQVECTINGLGERAGNAALEEVVMALHTRSHFYGMETRINTREITRTSQLVADCTGVRMACNKPIVGANAFAHEAGIHQDGVLKHRGTYEIMSSEQVGANAGWCVLGKHSGRNAFRTHVQNQLGFTLSDDALSRAFAQFKMLADRHKIVSDHQIARIVESEIATTVDSSVSSEAVQ